MNSVGTKTRQQVALGQGLALGALMLGVESVNGNKPDLEWDFRRAWQDWEYTHHFPAVHVSIPRNDVLHILYDSKGRRGPILAYWEGSWPFVPTLRVDGWTADEIAAIILESIPAAAWEKLVRSWLIREQ